MNQLRGFISGILQEARWVTLSFKMISDIKKNVPHFQLMNVWTLKDGTVGLFKNDEDKNLYEIEIRPIVRGKHKDLWGNIIKNKEDREGFNPDPLSNNDIIQMVSKTFADIYVKMHIEENSKKKIVFKIFISPNITQDNINLRFSDLESFGSFQISNIQNNDKSNKFFRVIYSKSN